LAPGLDTWHYKEVSSRRQQLEDFVDIDDFGRILALHFWTKP